MDFVNLPIENLDVKTKTINQKKVDIDLKYFLKNDIIIISSGTATGKTKDVAKKIKDILKHCPGCHILSIVNLISLALEQLSTLVKKDFQLYAIIKRLTLNIFTMLIINIWLFVLIL